MEHRREEIALLNGKAESCLKQPISLLPILPRTNYSGILRLWHSSSFYEQKSWCLYQPSGVSRTRYQPAVVETCWDMPHDHKRMSDPMEGLKSGFQPEPTIKVRLAAFDLSNHSTLLTQQKMIGLAFLSDHKFVGLDGETWGFENFDYSQGVRLQWWGNGPSSWQPLIETFHKLLEVIQGALKAKDYQPYQRELYVEPLKEIISE